MIRGIEHLSADAIWALAAMGHGDSIAIVDANYPAYSMAKDSILINLHGESTLNVVLEVLQLIPLDHAVDKPIEFMLPKPGLEASQNTLIKELNIAECCFFTERHSFYESSKKCFAIISTTSKEPFLNLIIKKGTLPTK